jgi:hypothetical protein
MITNFQENSDDASPAQTSEQIAKLNIQLLEDQEFQNAMLDDLGIRFKKWGIL